MPLRKIPTFTIIARLDIPCSSLIEGLPCPVLRNESDMAGPATGYGEQQATPRHPKFLVGTPVGPRDHRASPVPPIPPRLQRLRFEVLDRLPDPRTRRPQLSCPC